MTWRPIEISNGSVCEHKEDELRVKKASQKGKRKRKGKIMGINADNSDSG